MSDRPFTQDRQRCFECGISYPPDAPECEVDQAKLWPETIHHVWRIEGVIAPRPGGATCAAYHLHTGERVAIDVVRVLHHDAAAGHVSQRGASFSVQDSQHIDDGAVRMVQAEAQALHVLDLPNLLRLFETGVDEHGIAYLVTELGTARPLGDLLEEWQRAGHFPVAGRAASQIGRQLLTVLVAAHRAGLSHQGLGAQHVFLLHEDELLAGRARAAAVRLRGLRALSLGQTIRGSIRADLRAVAGLLYELITGEPAADARDGLRERTIPSGIEPALWEVVIRGLGHGRADAFASADDMLRALAVAVPPVASEVSATALATLGRTDPGAGHSSTEEIPVAPEESETAEGVSAPNSSPGPVSRMSGPLASLPALPQPFLSEPAPRSSISGELQAVSFRDLFDSEQGPRRIETLAQSRRRVSAASLKIPALPMPVDGVTAAAVAESNSQPGLAQLGNSGDHASLEPTADLSALPIADFASQSSGRIHASIGEPHAEMRAETHQPARRIVSVGNASQVAAGPSAAPEPIDPYAATEQVRVTARGPATPSAATKPSAEAANLRIQRPEAQVLPLPSKVDVADMRQTVGSGTRGPSADASARQATEQAAALATSAELDARHARRYTWAIAIAAVVVLVALWLLVQ